MKRTEERRCRWCQGPLSSDRPIYCRFDCYTAARKAAAARICQRCRGPIKGRGKKYCSDRCFIAVQQAAAEQLRAGRLHPCERCGTPTPVKPWLRAEGRGRFCSASCQYAARRKFERPYTLPCAQCGKLFPTAGRRPQARFCSVHCYHDSLRKPHACEQCGRHYPPLYPGQRFCSRECGGLARRKRETHRCPICQTAIERRACEVRAGARRACSIACAAFLRRRSQKRACRRCHKLFDVQPCVEKTRRYCSWACFVGPHGGSLEIICRGVECGRRRRVSAAVLKAGRGKFCSRACFISSRRRPWTHLSCAWPECPKPEGFWVLTSAAVGRKYCSRDCFHRALQKRANRCRICRAQFVSSPRREQRFCSHACAYRGRQRSRDPAILGRNSRILELRAAGLNAPRIQRELLKDTRCVEGEEGAVWRIEPAAIRQVIWSEGERQRRVASNN
jgi:hypothetical protein